MTTAILAAMLAAAPQTLEWKFDTGSRAELDVSNVDGSVHLAGTGGSEVRIEAQVPAETEGRPRWRVEARQEGAKVRVEVCCGGCERRLRREGCEGGVRLNAKAPAQSAVDLTAVSAAVWVREMAGPLEVSSVSGDVDISGSASRMTVSNVSGRVSLAPKVLAPAEVQTVSGDVRMSLPAGAGARVSLSTISGSLNGRSEGIGSRERSFGDGRTPIEVSTVSGSLEVDEPSTSKR